MKTLGLTWSPITDTLVIKCQGIKDVKPTKRNLLSEISKLFDPLGLINPIIVSAKILLQQLWKLKIDWDQTLPAEIIKTWNDIRTDFNSLNNIKIPRYLMSKKQRQWKFMDSVMPQ